MRLGKVFYETRREGTVMTRTAALAAALLTATTLAACGGTGGNSSSEAAKTPAAKQAKLEPADITLWVGFTQRELKVFKEAVKGFEAKNPGVNVKVVGGINDDKIVAASRGGKAPDVAQSFSADNAGAFCGSGAWVDLAPYMKRDGISDSIFPAAPRSYTQFEGKRCALPMLADVMGLYYNKAMLEKAGLDGPPKTVSELTEYAKKLTVKNPDGSLKVVGFNPTMNWYSNTPANFGPMFGAQWVDGDGKSTIGSDPNWAKLLSWQKELIDFYGYDNLVKFQAGLGDEFSPANAFEKGKVAMNIDGEWRTAFIADESPNLDYGTAPVPVDDAQPDLYGGGYTTGNIAGVPKRAAHPEQGWALLKYLTTDDEAMVALSNGLRNVPTTASSTKSPDLKPDDRFETFVKIFGDPNTTTTPVTAAGSANQELFNSFVNKWQAGRVTDLEGGLAGVAKQIDDQLANAEGQNVP
jgi:multiple sugar transport system substrate-binding protein